MLFPYVISASGVHRLQPMTVSDTRSPSFRVKAAPLLQIAKDILCGTITSSTLCHLLCDLFPGTEHVVLAFMLVVEVSRIPSCQPTTPIIHKVIAAFANPLGINYLLR
jgi:hypothetical protein